MAEPISPPVPQLQGRLGNVVPGWTVMYPAEAVDKKGRLNGGPSFAVCHTPDLAIFKSTKVCYIYLFIYLFIYIYIYIYIYIA